MKNRLFLSLAALAISATAIAQQPEAGTISIIPRVALNMSTLPDDIFVMGGTTNIPLEARYRTTFMGGVDVDYQFAPNFSATLGATMRSMDATTRTDWCRTTLLRAQAPVVQDTATCPLSSTISTFP